MVDDEEFCISSIKSIMESAGIDVENKVDFCINGQEAVEQVKKSYSLRIDYFFVFTDFSMPVMDGIQLTRQLRHFFEQELAL